MKFSEICRCRNEDEGEKKYQKIIFKRLAFCWKVFKRENKKKRSKTNEKRNSGRHGYGWHCWVAYYRRFSVLNFSTIETIVVFLCDGAPAYSKWSLREWLMEAIKPRVVSGKIGHCRSIVSMRWWDASCASYRASSLIPFAMSGWQCPSKQKRQECDFDMKRPNDDEKAHVTGS